jgi:short-subunit dehydrogenase
MHILILGATSAIAHAFAKRYAKESNHVFTLLGRNQLRLNACASELMALGQNIVNTYAIDFMNDAMIIDAIEKSTKSNGPIDIAFLAQGSLSDQVKANTDLQYLRDEFTLNLLSIIIPAQFIANHFKEKKSGILIGIGSVAGERGRKGNYAYGAAKSAIHTFLSGIRNDIGSEKIRIMTIKPGFVATPMTSHLKQSFLFVSPDFIAKEIIRGIEQGIDHMYIPSFWRLIMMIIRAIPEKIFMKMNI